MKFQVWIEGWSANEGTSPALLWGEVEASSFAEACRLVAERRAQEADEAHKKGASWYDYRSHMRMFDPVRLSHWGCRLFDNEADARKAFG